MFGTILVLRSVFPSGVCRSLSRSHTREWSFSCSVFLEIHASLGFFIFPERIYSYSYLTVWVSRGYISNYEWYCTISGSGDSKKSMKKKFWGSHAWCYFGKYWCLKSVRDRSVTQTIISLLIWFTFGKHSSNLVRKTKSAYRTTILCPNIKGSMMKLQPEWASTNLGRKREKIWSAYFGGWIARLTRMTYKSSLSRGIWAISSIVWRVTEPRVAYFYFIFLWTPFPFFWPGWTSYSRVTKVGEQFEGVKFETCI